MKVQSNRSAVLSTRVGRVGASVLNRISETKYSAAISRRWFRRRRKVSM